MQSTLRTSQPETVSGGVGRKSAPRRAFSLQSLLSDGEDLDEDDEDSDVEPAAGAPAPAGGLGLDLLSAARSVADKFLIHCLMDDTLRPFYLEARSLERLKVQQAEAIFAALRFGEYRSTAPLSLAAHKELSEEHVARLRGKLEAAATEHFSQIASASGPDDAEAFAARLADSPGVVMGLLPASEHAEETAEQADALTRKGGAAAARKVLGVEYAPLSVPIKRRRQMFGCVASCSTIPAASIVLGTMLYLWRRTWPFLSLYLPWALFLDRSPWTGGKTPCQWLRRLWIFKQFAAYFPASLIKSNPASDFRGERPMLMGYHPHGILSFGAVCNFGFDVTGWPDKFPGLTPRVATLNMNLKFPFLRELVSRLGFIPAARNALKAALSPGNVVILVVGGAAEALDTKPGEYVLTLARRTGFFRLALETGADLVPSFGFGENDIFDTVTKPGSILRKAQAKLYKVMGFSMPLFYGRGVFTYNYGLLPYRRPLHVVVGEPIRVERNPQATKEQVEELKAKYIEGLRRLYEEWQPRLEPGQTRQLIVV